MECIEMPGENLSSLILAIPKWVFTFLAAVISLVIIYGMFFASCKKTLFGLPFGPEGDCKPPVNSETIVQVVSNPLFTDLSTMTNDTWSSNLAEIKIIPRTSASKLLVSASGNVDLKSAGKDPHRACSIAIYVDDTKIACTNVSFNKEASARSVPFYLEGEYTSNSNNAITFALRIWQRRGTKATLRFNQSEQHGPGLFKVIEVANQKTISKT
jgi:hypothetical protein